jgi:hypothetical protein
MCNCGKKRVEYSQHSHHGNVPRRPVTNTRMAMPERTFAFSVFEYTGKTALTVIGNVTGTNYRFNFPGNKQNIDNRDIAGIMSVPVLKKMTR